jgi:hypothetical protein
MTTLAGPIQIRYGTAAAWASADPTLLAGEMGVESDTGQSKVGDGATAWTALDYAFATAAQGALADTALQVADGDARYEPLGFIEEKALSGLNSVTFSDIPQTFIDLHVVVKCQLTATMTAARTLYIRFNGDSGGNYDYCWAEINGATTPGETESYGQGLLAVGRLINDLYPFTARIDVADYTDTVFSTAVLTEGAGKSGETAGALRRQVGAGWWRATDAITSLTLLMNTGADTWAPGSTARLYGKK